MENELTIQKKAINLFKYLQAIQEKQDSIVYNYAEHKWIKFIKDLPDDEENIDFHYRDYVKFDDDYTGLEDIPYILKVHNPDFDACPKPSEKLMPWLQDDWNDFHVSVPKVKERIPIAGSKPVRYKDFRNVFDSQVMYDKWMEKRELWRERQLMLEKSKSVFIDLFNNRQSLLKEDGNLELLIANGLFQVSGEEKLIHPLLLKRVTIEFDSEHNDVYIKDIDGNSNFYIELFNKLPNIDGKTIQDIEAKNSQEQYYPLDRNEAQTFFKRVIHAISPDGKYFASSEAAQKNMNATFKLSWEPMLILRKRPSGMAKMINKIIEKINTTGDVPKHLINILQPGNNFVDAGNVGNESEEEKLAAVGGEAIDILLPKEANQEQLEIAKTIDRNDAVVVQGPPGTGKTHTIANLLGHFLAQGKRVLVTSHTNKALKVLKDKVEKELQPLCVSITDESKKDIESSIAAIASLSEVPDKLKRDIRECENKRNDIINKLNTTRGKLFQLRNQQCNTIVLNGEAFSPIEAAKFIKDNRGKLGDIIPGKVEKCDALPVPYNELADLYDSNTKISLDEEQQLACQLPAENDIWSENKFAEVVTQYQSNKKIVDELTQQNNWFFAPENDFSNSVNMQGIEIGFHKEMEAQLLETKDAINGIKAFAEWELRVIADGINPLYKSRWEQLITKIQTAYSQYAKVENLKLGKEVRFTNLAEAKMHMDDYRKLLASDGEIGIFQKWFGSSLKQAKQCVTINNTEIASGQDAELVLEYLDFYNKEATCQIAWKQLLAEYGIEYSNIEVAYKYAKAIEKLLVWYTGFYGYVLQKINACGIAVDKIAPEDELTTDLNNLKASLEFNTQVVPKLIDGMLAFMKKRASEQQLNHYYQQVSRGTLVQSAACLAFANAIKDKNVVNYNEARTRLCALITKYNLQNSRFVILNKLKKYAPEWANAIKNRHGIHGNSFVPKNITEAWKWKQLEREIDEINSCDYNALQKQAVSLAKDYRKATAKLAAVKAKYELQKRNLKDAERQCILLDLGQLLKLIGKGTGKKAGIYRKLASEQMSKCQGAVPVWIMPVRTVLETFDPLTMKEPFDIVIVDEASQSNLTALAVTFLGNKVIIVGDDKQVSPLAVGQEEAPIQEKADLYISRWLTHKKVVGLKTSLYDIASSSYIHRMLLEHFRCVPEIIGYSNWLSYDNKIKPLREASSSNLLPAIVNYRVDGHRDGKRKINKIEVESIVALIQACIEQPEYRGKTFGVISLVGKEQAEYIQMELFRRLSNIEYENRQIICGDSANFQGDERDVIFLSMIDSCEEKRPLDLQGFGKDEMYRKRYNVAASRAKDQLWIINSLDEETDLKPNDIRKDLLSYAKNPQNYKQTLIQIEKNSDSPFEAAVAKALVSRGFHIVQQWAVGAYRIDMVAVYKNRKIAIECDGERYHSGADKILEDMQRQTILERLGWKFIRIRGSEYYSDPENTISRVVDTLSNYGIKEEDNFTVTPSDRNIELLQRVKQRADEILRGDNLPKPEPPKPEPPKPKPPKLKVVEDQILPLIRLLESKNVKYQDNRSKKGGFWLIGGGELSGILNQASKMGFAFQSHKEKNRWLLTNIKSSKEASCSKPVKQDDSLIALLKKYKINYIDKRNEKGSLWIIGGKELQGFVDEAAKIGVKFYYKQEGGRVSKHKPAWWAK